ncbi:unnamed protein product [Dracunculus medinensis]|uniref:Biogenesis of lysosome-related organelles complex 1 subunit 1 n=1 Tax=Dracunculus medinensis TaxID=318479 RepID=A0A0N4U492_DRAME|nr:unnamed protein product [Dracunculus medinensis]
MRLAWKLAKAESELESARIKLEIQEKANKAAFDGKNEEWHFEKYKGLDDLLNEIEGNGPVPLSPNTIRKNCDRMMDHVRENGCQFDITNNMFDLAENQLLNTKLGSVWNDCTRSDFRGQEKELKVWLYFNAALIIVDYGLIC